MAEAFIEKTEYNQYLSTQDYIDQFYGDKEGISTTKILSSPILLSTSDYLFSDFIGLQYINFPNLSNISHKAFSGCINLKEANIPNVTYIDSYAFKDCINLKILSLPSCISMKESAFEGCTSLEELYLPEFSNYFYSVFTLKDLPELRFLNINGISRGVRLINLPKLESLQANNLLSFNSGSTGYLSDLPMLSSLVLEKLTLLNTQTLISLPNLETFILPECMEISSNIFGGQLPLNDILFSLPKVKSMNFTNNCSTFKSVTFPAVSNDSDLYNVTRGLANDNPYYMGFPNLTILSRSTICYAFELLGYNSRMSHDMIVDFPNLSMIHDSFQFSLYAFYNISGVGLIFNSPELKYIPSGCFGKFRVLKEINLNNISILEERVFENQFRDGTDPSLSLKNVYNIKEVKAGAFNYVKLRDYELSLPNCESFDFRQFVSRSNYFYSICIFNGDASATFSSHIIDKINLPRISEIKIEASLNGSSSYDYCIPEYLLPQKELRLDNCKRISFIGDSVKQMRRLTNTDRSCCSLYLPECESIEYIRGEIDNSTFNVIFPIHEIYAPKLSYISNITFINTYSLCMPLNSISYIKLLYWLGWVSEINHSESFGGIININSSFITRNDGRSFYLSNVNLPNYTGEFKFDTSSAGISSYLSDRIDFLFGENTKDVQITFDNIYSPNYYTSSTLLNINITTLKNIIDNHTAFRNYYGWGGYYYGISMRIDNFYFPNTSIINYNLSISTLTVYSNFLIGYSDWFFDDVYVSSLYDCQWFLIFYNHANLMNLQNLETIELNITGCSSISYISSYCNSSFIDLYLEFHVNELYAPKLRKINYNICTSLASIFPSLIHCGFNVTGKYGGKCTSVTLGISTLEDMCRLTTYERHSSILSWFGPSLPYIKYLSMSNLKNIPPMLPVGLQDRTHTLYLPNCEYLNIENIEYISDRGLQVDKLEQLNLPKLKYIGSYGIKASLLKIISVPKLEELGDYGFYSCYSLETLTLPSTCSRLGQNFCYNQGRLKVLELQYPGVVGIAENQDWRSMTVRVPSAYLSAYKSHSIWGVRMSSYWNIVAF